MDSDNSTSKEQQEQVATSIKEPEQSNNKEPENQEQKKTNDGNGVSSAVGNQNSNNPSPSNESNGNHPANNNVQNTRLASAATASSNSNRPTNVNSTAVPSNSNRPTNVNSTAKASEEKEDKPSLPFFHFTQGKYWDGPNASYTVLKVLSSFPLTGFFGWDHLYLRSPLSAFLKSVMNILTLGLWYFYDMAQVLGEPDIVKNAGMAYPLLGSTGLGAGIFKESDPEKGKQKGGGGGGPRLPLSPLIGGDPEEGGTNPSPMMFLVYTLLVLLPLPFALEYFALGDFTGGMAKMFANWTFFLIIFSLFGWFISIFRMVFQTERLFSEGIPRFFPFTLIMSDSRCLPGTLGPNRPCKDASESGEGFFAFIRRLFGGLKGIPVIGSLVGLVETVTDIASQAYNNYGKPLVTAGAAAVTLVPKVASEVTSKVGEIASIDSVIREARQQGGGARPKPQSSQREDRDNKLSRSKTERSSDEDRSPKEAALRLASGQREDRDNGTSIFVFVGFAVVAAVGVFLANIRNIDVIDVTDVLPRTAFSTLRNVWFGNKHFFSPFSRKHNDSPPNPTTV